MPCINCCIIMHETIMKTCKRVKYVLQTFLWQLQHGSLQQTLYLHTLVDLASSSCFFNSVNIWLKSTVSLSLASSWCVNFLLFLFLFFLAALLPTFNWFAKETQWRNIFKTNYHRNIIFFVYSSSTMECKWPFNQIKRTLSGYPLMWPSKCQCRPQ